MKHDASASFGFGDSEPDAVDYASMLAELEQRVAHELVKRVLGADGDALDRVRAGHAPGEQLAARVRELYELSRRTDLDDPDAVFATLIGASRDEAGARLLTPVLAARRGLLLAFAAFAALDLLVGAAIVAYFVATR